jgi:hypothetical protein
MPDARLPMRRREAQSINKQQCERAGHRRFRAPNQDAEYCDARICWRHGRLHFRFAGDPICLMRKRAIAKTPQTHKKSIKTRPYARLMPPATISSRCFTWIERITPTAAVELRGVLGAIRMSNAWPIIPPAHRWRGAAEPWSLVARVGLLIAIALLIGFGARVWIGAAVL